MSTEKPDRSWRSGSKCDERVDQNYARIEDWLGSGLRRDDGLWTSRGRGGDSGGVCSEVRRGGLSGGRRNCATR